MWTVRVKKVLFNFRYLICRKLIMRVALFKSLLIAFLLYRFGTFDDQWTGNFLLLRFRPVVITSLLKTIFVSRKISGFTSTVGFIFGWLLLSFWIRLIFVSPINNIIHKPIINCQESYIGETVRHVEIRWQEHEVTQKDSEPEKLNLKNSEPEKFIYLESSCPSLIN